MLLNWCLKVYTEFINSGRVEKNWDWGMETRRFKMKYFALQGNSWNLHEFWSFLFLLNGAVFFPVNFEITELKLVKGTLF